MRVLFSILLCLVFRADSIGQGFIWLSNIRVPQAFPFTPRAPIYGPEPSDPTLALTGQTAAGIPAGTQTYGGILLGGTGYTLELWAAPASGPNGASIASPDDFSFVARTTFRAFGSGLGLSVQRNVSVPGIEPGQTAWLQLRAYDNLGGTIQSWDQVLAADGTQVARGVSPILLSLPLGATADTAPWMEGLQSANIHFVAVPAPSLAALALLAAAFCGSARRRSRTG